MGGAVKALSPAAILGNNKKSPAPAAAPEAKQPDVVNRAAAVASGRDANTFTGGAEDSLGGGDEFSVRKRLLGA